MTKRLLVGIGLTVIAAASVGNGWADVTPHSSNNASSGHGHGHGHGHSTATSLEAAVGAGETSAETAVVDAAILDANSALLSEYIERLGVDDGGTQSSKVASVAQNPSNLTVTVWWAGDAPLPSEPNDPKFAHVTLEVFEAERSHAEVMSMIQRSGVAEWDGIWSTASKADGSAAILLHDPSAEIDGEAASAAIGLPVITVADAPPNFGPAPPE